MITEAQNEWQKLRAAHERDLHKGAHPYVATVGFARVLIRADSQADARHKLLRDYQVRHLIPPTDDEILVRLARPDEVEEFS